MEAVLSWLNRPLVPDSPILIWMALALCAGLALALILVLALVRKRKKRAAHEKDPVTAKPGPLPVLELANLQGLGSREEQQDPCLALRRTAFWRCSATGWAAWPREDG